MNYKPRNFLVLQEIYALLKAFPFNEEDKKLLKSMDLEGILNEYQPYSDMENDPVANAICWGISTLQSLFNKKPVRALDEVLSFVEYTLNGQGKAEH